MPMETRYNIGLLSHLCEISFTPLVNWLTNAEGKIFDDLGSLSPHESHVLGGLHCNTGNDFCTSNMVCSDVTEKESEKSSNRTSKKRSFTQTSFSSSSTEHTNLDGEEVNSSCKTVSTDSQKSMSCTSECQAIKRRKILIVNNQPFERKLLCRLLGGRGHTCDEATSGKEGLILKQTCDQLITEEYDVVLLDLSLNDIELPSVCGIDVVDEIRKQGFKGPIIGAASYLPDEKNLFLELGITTLMSKPYNLKVIDEILDEI
jgi:CheY-like chemotaxis protein